jgi:nitrite reductase (NADH) large subunit
VSVASFGDPFIENEDVTCFNFIKRTKRINVTKGGKTCLAEFSRRDSSDYNGLFQYIVMHGLTSNRKTRFLVRGGEGSGNNGLADTAVICSCENVTKGAICCSIDATCETLGDVVINKSNWGLWGL